MAGLYEQLTSSDWLQRNSANFTHQRKDRRIGWERHLKDGKPFSSMVADLDYDLKYYDDRHKLVLVKGVCNNLLSVMNVDKKPIRLYFTDKRGVNFTDLKNIVVSLDALKPSYDIGTLGQRTDIIAGFTVHEMCHVLWTTEASHKWLMDLPDTVHKLVMKNIHNAVEDERIEMELGRTFAGYANFLSKTKQFVWGLKVAEGIDEEELAQGTDAPEAVQNISELFNQFLLMVRYPTALDPDLVLKHEDKLREIQDILTPYPKTEHEVFKACEAIYKVFEDFIKELPKQQQQQMCGGSGGQQGQADENEQSNSKVQAQMQSSGGEQGEEQNSAGGGENGDDNSEDEQSQGGGGQGNDDTDGNGQDQGNDKDEENEDDTEQGNGNSGDGQDEDEQDQGQNQQPQGGLTEEQICEALGNALKKVLEAVESADPTSKDNAQLGDENDRNNREAGAVDNMSDAEIEDFMPQTDWHVFPPRTLAIPTIPVKFKDESTVGNEQRYLEALKLVKDYAPQLRAKLAHFNRNQRDTYRGLMEGAFDEESIADAVAGSKTVYKQTANIVNKGATVVLLVDESGSMSGYDHYARAIAVLFERALEGLNDIDFYCYGHSTCDTIGCNETTLIVRYYEGRRVGDASCLGRIKHRMYNRDGHALVETVKRVRTKTKQPIIVFMISDGQPSAALPVGWDEARDQIRYTKQCVDFVEDKMNTQVIHVAIREGVESESMFRQYCTFFDFAKLIPDMYGLLLKVITKVQMPEITYEDS